MASKLLLSLAALFAFSAAIPYPAVGNPGPGYVSFPVEHVRNTLPIMKRADTNVPLFNVSVVSYLVALSIGTPGQAVKVAIDTGSDELWVNPLCNTVQNARQRSECVANGKYNPRNSSSGEVSQETRAIRYGKGEVTIQYVRDSISLPESTISLEKVIFGAAVRSKDLNEGIMGLGYGNGVNLNYNNIIDDLAAQNVTRSRAFTVALGSVDANNGGVIIFGGVDTKKFSGKLGQLPILPPQGNEKIRRYWVKMDSVGISGAISPSAKTYTGSSTPIVVDSGSSLSYLPAAVISQMANDTGARYSQQDEVYYVPCFQRTSKSTFDFVFGSTKIAVPFSDFIWEAGPGQCILGGTGSTSVPLLGDTFMRSAYVVFDQSNNDIFMGQYANCGQNEQVIPSTPGAVANFTGECRAGEGTTNSTQSAAPSRVLGGEPGKIWVGTLAAFVLVQLLLSLALG